MKKKALIIIAILVILLIGALAVGINIYNNIANNSEISKQGAIEIALENANVKESDAARISAYLNLDDLKRKYEIEFVAGDYEYEYEIDADNGLILDFSKEKIGLNVPAIPDPNSNEYIGEESAKQVAYDNAGVSEVSFVRVHLDSDDGIVYYDVEFRSGDYEYNYDIDAKSGALLERDIDKELF